MRGNNRQKVFFYDNDYNKFTELIIKAKTKYHFHLYAFVLMPNHYHLLFKPSASAKLSKIMQWLNTSYTVHFNKKYGRVGHLFQGRYKNILIQEDPYLLELLRYIHQNPVRAGLAKEVRSYTYSSYPFYVSENAGDLVETDEILKLFAERHKTRIKRFMSFIEESRIKKPFRPESLVRNQLFMGSTEFEINVRKMLENKGLGV